MDTQLKVLCVDDHPDAADSAVLVLEQAGFEARGCLSGAAALAEAEVFGPDVCLIDLAMPGMTGEELAARLRERPGGTPPRCIALTGSWDIASQHRTNNAGFEQHLVKPVEPDRLIAAVRGQATAGAD